MKNRYPDKAIQYLFHMIVLGILFPFIVSGCLTRQLGGAFSHEPDELEKGASPGAQMLIARAFNDVTPDRLVDYHVHIAGLGTSGSGAFVNPRMKSWFNPVERMKFGVYVSASGIKSMDNADQEYVRRLVDLIQHIGFQGKYRILGFDKYYNPDGSVNLDKTTFYVPNAYIFELVQRYPDLFLPVVSVHPYRPDALVELEKWARKGAKYVKWLPNAMGIDPSSPQTDAFYRMMQKYNMILLSHTGEEYAVESEQDQQLGNPLLLRKPLGYGLRVIMAHCASLGRCADLDNPGSPDRPCFDLFLRLMEEKKYEGLLYADISALAQFNRLPVPISTVLLRQDLHHRLVNGSDYPMPAINVLLRTRDLMEGGFISATERRHLNEIYSYNPLLFDYVLKRTLRHPKTGRKLSPSIFMGNPRLEN